MKILIKKLLREVLLSEKLLHVDNDVNFLFDKYFKHDVEMIQKTGIINKNMFKKFQTNTSILKSDDCVRAHNLRPCVIQINSGGNFYNPKEDIIGIGYSKPAYDFVMDNGDGNIENSLIYLDNPNQSKSLKLEFTEERIKGSIHHELAHWIDDTMNNNHLSAKIDKFIKHKTKNLGGIPVDASKMEIQAQIHNIKQLHNKYRDVWDVLSFEDMIDLSPSLTNVNNKLNRYSTSNMIGKKWRRELILRMNREGLLGKNMKI